MTLLTIILSLSLVYVLFAALATFLVDGYWAECEGYGPFEYLLTPLKMIVRLFPCDD